MARLATQYCVIHELEAFALNSFRTADSTLV